MAKILLIEDEALLREEVLEWLLLEDYEVMGASNGVEGLKMARQEQPDLIISDITMPALDGFGVLMELRSDLASADIPFIFMTARAAHDDIRQGMNLGADDYITKPFTRLELLNAIEARLDKKYAQTVLYEKQVQQWQIAFEEEKTQRLLKAKVIGMFSHDFRNPLASILSSASLLRKYEDRISTERKHTHLNKIESSVRRLIQMLDDMLVVVQMDSGYLQPELEKQDITAFVKDIVDEFADIHIDSHKVSFTSNVVTEAEIDSRLLRQIVSNLSSNAFKYSPIGSKVRVTLEESDDKIVLRVQDEGIGIPPDELPTLFEPFHRAANVGEKQGTGLGLTIVKQAVDLHSGSISVVSTVDVGTAFTVCIPKQSNNR